MIGLPLSSDDVDFNVDGRSVSAKGNIQPAGNSRQDVVSGQQLPVGHLPSRADKSIERDIGVTEWPQHIQLHRVV